MHCPRDNSELKTRLYEGDVEIDECSACCGRFFDKGELEAIQVSMQQHRDPAHSPPPHTMVQDVESLVNCPKCSVLMVRRRYGLGVEMMIDECPDGCGLWLDGGELEALEAFYAKSHDEAKIPLTSRILAAIRGRANKASPPRD
jgi:Zn-finger nucleic acid-binding protein